MADNNRDKVLSCLTEAGEPLSIRNLTATTGIKTEDAKAALDELQSEGKVEASGSGRSPKWSLAAPAEPDTAEPASEADPVEPADVEAPAPEDPDEPQPAEPDPEAEETEPPAETNEENNEEERPVATVPEVDPEMVFAATMLDQFARIAESFTVEWFARTCGKATTAERTRLLRTLWALAEHDLVDKADPNDVDGGVWTVITEGLAATVVAQRIQVTDAPEEIEVRIVKRMPWANGGTKGNRSAKSGLRGDTKPARVRGELRKQIDAVLAALEPGETVTPGWVAEAVRKDDPHHRDADPNAVNNYLKELQLSGSLTDATAETGQRAYRLA